MSTTLYAAVIEWPYEIADRDPALILTRSIEDRATEIIAELREVADALTDDDWRTALAGVEGDEWADQLEALAGTRYGAPFITLHEKEIPA